jgi:hypothetical protein
MRRALIAGVLALIPAGCMDGFSGDAVYLDRQCAETRRLERGSAAYQTCVADLRQYLEQQRALQKRAIGGP